MPTLPPKKLSYFGLDDKALRYRRPPQGQALAASCVHGVQKTIRIAWVSLLMLCTPGYGQLPNIVVIVADDVGLGDIGRQHTERTGLAPLAPTPNLDALANEGMWFTDAHSPTALCAPSRYAFMSGNYNYRSYKPGGVWNAFDPSAITTNDVTLGSITKDAGYTTGFVGKWHMGGDYYVAGSTTTISRISDDSATPAQIDLTNRVSGGPQSLGFDYDFTVATGVQGPVYLAHENKVWYPLAPDSAMIFYDTNTASEVLFVSDKGPGVGDSNWDARALNMLLADKAATFITNSAATSSEPFCLYYCSPAVHLPHTPADTIDGVDIAGTTPSPHTDMNRVLDLEVKRIVDAVKATGEYDNTLIIFTSDNGGLFDPVAQATNHFSNGGFRGTKNSAFEGGHRVPFIAVWPDVVPTNTRCHSMINGTDILATLAAITETSYPDDQANDSYNLLPILEGDTNHVPRTELVLQAGSQNELMFRQGPWKLIMSSSAGANNLVKADTTPTHLFNLDDYPAEPDAQNLVNNPAYTNMVSTMYERYWELRESTNRSAPSYVAPSDLVSIFNEDFSSISFGDTTALNQQITDGSYDTGLRLSNHVVGEIVTNSVFGTGNVLQLSTGTNPIGGFGALSAANNPYPVSFTEGEEVVLSFDMLVQALPEGVDNILIELRMTGANNISRSFTEYHTATTGDVVSVSWSTTVDADMANATDISIWIPIEGLAANYSTIGPNEDGTDIDVMQLDDLSLGVLPVVPPSPPDTISATGGDSQITLSWSAVSNAVSYDVFRSTTTGTYGVATTNVAGLSWIDTSVANGFKYYYVIQSIGSVTNRSINSAEVYASASASVSILDEDFSSISFGDTTTANQQITDGSYDTGLRLNNHAVGEIVTNPVFGTGNVLQLSTGTNPSGGFGALTAENNPYPVSFTEGENVVLSLDMLVQTLPEGVGNISIELRMTGANNITRSFTEYHTANTGDVVSVSWSTTVDADMANATDISILIPIEGLAANYSTVGPNGDGTDIDVMQLDNLQLRVMPLSSGFAKFEDEYALTGGVFGDDDGDEWENIAEFALGLDPVVTNARDVVNGEVEEYGGANYLTLTYPRSREAQPFVQMNVLRTTELTTNDWQEGQTVVKSVVPDGIDPDVDHIKERSTFSVDQQNREFLILEVRKDL